MVYFLEDDMDVSQPRTAQARQTFYDEISPLNLTPLWEVLHALVPPQPQSPCVASLWKYEQLEQYLKRSGHLISAQEAVRRVLILENPALRGHSCITQSLYAGLQLILPGEVAPSHRHTQSALRFIVQGSGAYTSVNGERCTMEPGDFIITPSMAWHDHGHEGHEPMVWLDGLDIPMLRFFDAGFAENNVHTSQEVSHPEGASFARYGHNMAPLRAPSPYGATSPIFSYPFKNVLEALLKMQRFEPIDAWDGFKLRYTNPLTGGWPMPTLGTFMQRLPKGFSGRPYRQTDGTVFSVVQGAGTAYIASPRGQAEFHFEPRDHFVVPSWHTLRLVSQDGCMLFSYSDRPVHQALGIHKEERLI
jgi:gentisate 1,2-dioxygenase